MRFAPGGSTASARLLCDSQGDALIEGTAVECHLSCVRTARDANTTGVDLRHLRTQLLQTVNQSAHAPGPFAIGTIILQFRIQTVEVVLTAFMMLAKLFIVIDLCRRERCRGDRPVVEKLTGQRYHIRANHQRIGWLANLRITDLRLERQGLLTYGDIDYQCVAIHPCLHLVSLYGRFLTDAVVLDERANLVAATLPILKTVDPLKGVRQFADNG